MNPTVIAIDFDGTITKPGCGDLFVLRPGCRECILELYELGFELRLWTCRFGDSLISAKEYLSKNGILNCFKGFNSNSEQISGGYDPRKIVADIYIDDRNFGGLPSWHQIVAEIKKEYCPSIISKKEYLSDGIISEDVFEKKLRPLFEENGFLIQS